MRQSKMNLHLVLLLLQSLVVFIDAELPPYLKPCDLSSDDLNACIKENVKSTLIQFGEGIPELSVPPLKDLQIQYSFLDLPNFHFALWKYHASGVELTEINNVGGDFENKLLIIDGLFPIVVANGLAKIKGNIFGLHFDSMGPISANVTKIAFRYQLQMEHVVEHGKTYLKKLSQQLDVNRTDGQFHVHLENLSFGNQEKSEMMNDVLNENGDQLLDIIFPILVKAVITYLDSSIDKLFEAYSFDDLYT